MWVRLWTSWPAPDGTVYQPGAVADVPSADVDAICQQGAGEPIMADAEPELAVVTAPERAVGRRQRQQARR